MNYDPVSIGAAPLVASAMGRKLGIKVVVSHRARTASIDEKGTLVLPLLPVDLDEQLAKILWGLIHHEAGHARHSDFEILKEPELRTDRLLLGLVRALEDVRMERAHISLYPGAARILSDLVRVLVDIGFFSPLPNDADNATVFHSFVLKYLRQTVLGQQALADQAKAARVALEQSLGAGFVTRLIAELQPILVAESTLDVFNLALRIREFLEEELAQQQQQPPSGDTSATDGNSEDASQSQPSGGQAKSSDDGDEDGDADTADPTASEDPNGSSEESDPLPDGGAQDPDVGKSLEEILNGTDLDSSLGDLGDALSDVLSDKVKDQVSRPLSLPRDHVRVAGRRDDHAVQAARLVSSRLAVQLKRQLESHNDVRSEPTFRGKRVSRRHLSRVAFNDYRVFTHREYLPEVNTAVVSLIDASGSMRGEKIELASKSILATSLAVGTIPFLAHCVGAFPSMQGDDKVELVQDFAEKVELVSSRFALQHRGCTPMAEALLWAADRLLSRSEERRIIFVATDGAPDDVDSTKRILKHLRKLRLEVHGLGIETHDRNNLFDSFVEVADFHKLPHAFLTLFQNVLRRSA